MGKLYKMDAQPTTIVKAKNDQAKLLADILSDSFENDPVMNWVIPNTKLYPGFFQMLAENLILPNGHAYLDSQGRGAALWLPPGIHFDMPMNLRQLFMVLRLVFSRGPKVLPRLETVQETMGRLHPTEPHYYLQSVGARQAHTGQGVGSALIKEVTKLCDEQQMPAYLESSNELNVPLYERHGFETFHLEELGGDGPPMWFMLRPPRAR
jgi:GNAT superfamily N-acetyltransferase